MTKPEPTPPTVEATEAFLATIQSSPRTEATYRYGLQKLAQFLHETQQPLTLADLQDTVLMKFNEWLIEQEYAPPTCSNYLSAVKRFLIWLDAHDRLPSGFQVGKAINRLAATRSTRTAVKPSKDPDPGLPGIVTYYDNIPLPAGDTYRGKLQRLDILRSRAIVHTLYASAGRVSEVAALTREAVLDGRKSEIRITGKGGKERVLLLTPEACRAIAAYCRERTDKQPGLFISHGRGAGRTLGRKTLWLVVKQAAQALDLYQGTSPHAFRHYRAQQLLHEGMDLDVLQTYLGHADIGTTRKVYAPYTDLEKVRDQLATYGQSAKDADQKSHP